MKPTVVKLKTESDEGPINVIIDEELVLTLDLKATPGIFHVVLPRKYRMKEVSHTSPELGEGVHYAVMLDYTQIEKEFLKKELQEIRKRCDVLQRREDARIQAAPLENKGKEKISPLLERWDDEAGLWVPEFWRNLEVGTRCRTRDVFSGALVEDKEGCVDWEIGRAHV